MVKQKQKNTTILTRQDYKNSLVTIIEVFQKKRKNRICKEYSPWNLFQTGTNLGTKHVIYQKLTNYMSK